MPPSGGTRRDRVFKVYIELPAGMDEAGAIELIQATLFAGGLGPHVDLTKVRVTRLTKKTYSEQE